MITTLFTFTPSCHASSFIHPQPFLMSATLVRTYVMFSSLSQSIRSVPLSVSFHSYISKGGYSMLFLFACLHITSTQHDRFQCLSNAPSDSTGAAEQVRQTRRPPDQCFEIASPTLYLQARIPRIRSMPARTHGVWRPENEQILSVLATHSRAVLLGIR